MGVDLKWEIDADDSQARLVTETRPAGGQRGKRLFLLLLIVLLCAGVAAAIDLRLREVARQQENALRATVEAEVTALRLDDEKAYFELQGSADQDWRLAQLENYDAWQLRKLAAGNPPGGEILVLEQDGAQAWVQVEEVIAGDSWTHTWHYRMTSQGWRHVAPAEGWRGAARSHRAENLLVEYDSLDEPLVQALAPQLEAWLARGCALLNCATLTQLTVQLQAHTDVPAWSPTAPWTLQLPSPWSRLTRTGEVLNAGQRNSLAQLLARRLLVEGSGQPAPDWTLEASWLHASAAVWLADRMLEQQGQQRLLESLATNYGEAAVTRVLRQLRPDSTLALFSAVTGAVALQAATLDWSDLLAWQLRQEAEYRLRAEQEKFLALYDLRDGALTVLARARFSVGEFAGAISVGSATLVSEAENGPLLRVEVSDATGTLPVYFRLVDGRWLRAS